MPIAWTESQTGVLALLACGHALADFVFQSQRMVDAKRSSPRVLARHAAIVAVVQGVILLPFGWSARGVALIAAIAVSHGLIDRLKIAYDRARPTSRLSGLILDQTLHLAVLGAVATLWRGAEIPASAVRAAALVAVVAFNGNGASALVSASLLPLQSDEQDDGPRGAGKRIGVLERWMILGLVSLGEWGAVGLVLTAKSVARFRKMDQQAFAEVYLVGTMTSVILAMASGLALQHVFRTFA